MKLNYSDIWREIAAAFPDRDAILCGTERMDYRTFAEQAGRLCSLLRDEGLDAGDRVAIFLYNRQEYLVTLFATLALGITPVPINFRYRAHEVDALLDDCDARAVLFPSSLGTVVDAMADRDGALWLRIDDGGAARTPREGERAFRDLDDYPAALPEKAPADGELFLYTGGTTGRPKGVVWGADDLLDIQLYSIYGSVGLTPPDSLEGILRVAADPATPTPVTMSLAPLMHGTALFNSMNVFVLAGAVVLLGDTRFDPATAVRLARDEHVTRLIVAGDAVAGPFADAAAEIGELPDLHNVISSGMRFSDPVKARLHALGELTIVDMLASTEGGPYAVANSHSAADLPAVLQLFPGAVVLDDDDEEVQDRPGARGRLAFRGTLPRGYHNDPLKTAEAFREIRGVRHVVAGDLVEVLPDGRIELLGRGSAVVNTGGEKVYPVEVEEALLTHALVEDAVVFGMPDERFGEAVTAVVAVPTGSDVDEERLRAHVDSLLAGYKKPRRIHLRESLERSPTGKVDMPRLKAELAAEAQDA